MARELSDQGILQHLVQCPSEQQMQSQMVVDNDLSAQLLPPATGVLNINKRHGALFMLLEALIRCHLVPADVALQIVAGIDALKQPY